MPARLRRDVARYHLGRHRDGGEDDGGHEHADQLAGIRRQAEEDEEHGREQVAQRGEHLAGVLRHPSGQRDADEERADGRRHVHLGGEAGDEHGEAEHAEQERLVVLGREDARDDVPVAQGEEEDEHARRRRRWPR